MFGGVPSVPHFLHLRNGPFVVAFYVSVVVMWVLAVYWVFFRGGAEALVRHPGLLNLPIQQPWAVKAFVILLLAVSIPGLVTMILWDVPGPN